MKNTIPASEIKRRGIRAVEGALQHGPVEVISRNRPRYVILSQEQYRQLTARSETVSALWDSILDDIRPGNRSAEDIQKQIRRERENWSDTR